MICHFFSAFSRGREPLVVVPLERIKGLITISGGGQESAKPDRQSLHALQCLPAYAARTWSLLSNVTVLQLPSARSWSYNRAFVPPECYAILFGE